MPVKARKWTAEEDAILREFYFSRTREEIGVMLGRSKDSVRKRCSVLGLNQKHPAVTDDEKNFIRSWYNEHAKANLEDFELPRLALLLNRTAPYISRLARKMGLTDTSRKQGSRLRENLSQKTTARLQKQGHPRGMLGKKHTDEFKAWQGKRVKEYWEGLTPIDVAIMTTKQTRTKIARYGTAAPTHLTGSNAYSRAKHGRRKDLNNQYFRSSWEANYARYLNFLISKGEILSWEYEAHTFVFHEVARGTVSYLPDFKVITKEGKIEWHEVKGWMDAKSKVKLKRMQKYYPEETLIVIGAEEYKAIAKWASLIDGWE